jgi:hypothetical protein
MPSLVNTLPRCHSTVWGLMNSWTAISWLVCPRARRAAASAAGPPGRASARTAGAARRKPAPSRTPPPRPGPPETPPPGRPHSPATPSSLSRARRARPAQRCYPARLIQHPIQHRPLPVAIQQPSSRTTSGRAHCCSDAAAQLATAADVISVGRWNEDHRWLSPHRAAARRPGPCHQPAGRLPGCHVRPAIDAANGGEVADT